MADVGAMVEEAVHDFEHPCEDHMCNFEGPDYDGTACPSDSSSAMVRESTPRRIVASVALCTMVVFTTPQWEGVAPDVTTEHTAVVQQAALAGEG